MDFGNEMDADSASVSLYIHNKKSVHTFLLTHIVQCCAKCSEIFISVSFITYLCYVQLSVSMKHVVNTEIDVQNADL
jgi:HKD family nuclease